VTVPANPNLFEVIFEATSGDGVFCNIAIDDVVYSQAGSCEYLNTTTTTTSTRQPLTVELTCDFESNDLCGWTTAQTDSQPNSYNKWTVLQGKSFYTPVHIGPDTDVTKQNADGYFVFLGIILENGPDHSQVDISLKSPPLVNLPTQTCLEFWYQFGILSDSQLAVYISDIDSNSTQKPLWQRSGNSAYTWNHVYVNIATSAASSANQTIEFRGSNARHPGYVALDDLRLVDGKCPAVLFCDFETDDLCGYQTDPTGEFRWTRNKNGTQTINTGPSFDHTFQTDKGHFMYIETTGPEFGNI
jgi:hypothetical protein